jgi:hypothetical protein
MRLLCYYPLLTLILIFHISTFNDLVTWISPTNNNYTDTNNAVSVYMASHFTKHIISMCDAGEEQVHFGTIGRTTSKYGFRPGSSDFVLNYQTKSFPNGLDINEYKSNNLAANWIIHVMDTLLMIPGNITRSPLLFFYLDVPGLPYDSLMDVALFRLQNGLHDDCADCNLWYWPPETGPNHIPFEKTNGWLTLNAPYAGNLKFDDHVNSRHLTPDPLFLNKPIGLLFGFTPCNDLLDITRKLPYIIPGKYKLVLITKTGLKRPSVQYYWDGKPIGGIINLASGTYKFEAVDIGFIEVKGGETEHYFREKMISTGCGFHAAIRLDPVD